MQIGLLYPYDEKKLEAELKARKPVALGIEVQSLLDRISVLEVRYAGASNNVLLDVKGTLLRILGKLPDEQPEKEAGGVKDGGD
jgi:hypothetical protein